MRAFLRKLTRGGGWKTKWQKSSRSTSRPGRTT
jgi:hypothetical protein